MYLQAHLIPPPVLQVLTQLTLSGMFGSTNEETAAILLKEKLREILRQQPPAPPPAL